MLQIVCFTSYPKDKSDIDMQRDDPGKGKENALEVVIFFFFVNIFSAKLSYFKANNFWYALTNNTVYAFTNMDVMRRTLIL